MLHVLRLRMAVPFSRSMRALHANSPSWTLFGLIVATLLIIAWALWFFFAGLALHETGQLSRVTSSGAVVAAFPIEAAERIRSGQLAVLRLQGMQQNRRFPAIVTHVSAPRDGEQLEVELYPQSRIAFVSIGRSTGQDGDNPIMGQATIEVARVTPAAVLMRTLAASRNPNAVPSSPMR